MALSTRNEYKILFWADIIQFVLYIIVLGISISRLALTSFARIDIWVLGVAVESLIILAYIVFSPRIAGGRWASTKANMILNIAETLFWGAAFVMSAMNIGSCKAVGCYLSGAIIAFAINLAVISLPVAWISIRHHQYYKRNGHRPIVSDLKTPLSNEPLYNSAAGGRV